MYTFLCERCPAGENPAGLLPPCRMPRSGAMDVRPRFARPDNFHTKFGLRTMKSLRKTVLMAGALLFAARFAYVGAQAARQGSAPPVRNRPLQRRPNRVA